MIAINKGNNAFHYSYIVVLIFLNESVYTINNAG